MYDYTKMVKLDFVEAREKAIRELQREGFGVLTEINVKETLKKKLGVDFPEYTILGACNPGFAFKALKAETEVGLLLPCNVIVFKKNGKTFVSSVLPTEAMKVSGNKNLEDIAVQVEEKLKKVIDSL